MRLTTSACLLGLSMLSVTHTNVLAQDHPQPTFAQLPAVPGVLPWDALSKVTSVKAKNGRLLPKYPDAVAALDKTQVKLQGFMMPLEPGEKQKHFLLTITSPSCAYCLPAGPEGVVEVKTSTPIKFTYSPVIIGGTMNVLKDDPMGLYYRITSATFVPR